MTGLKRLEMISSYGRSSPAVLAILILLIGVGVAAGRFGMEVLNPFNANWLLAQGDPAAHYIGWLFFKSEPWTFPFGKIVSYMTPFGTSVGQTDSIPVSALFFKLFKDILPFEFQYFGLWFATGYGLQAVFGFLLMREFTERISIQVIGALFFLFSPIMLYRDMHIALSSHWLLLAALLLYIRDWRNPIERRAVLWHLLLIVSALVHPYIAIMVLGIYAADGLRSFLDVGWSGAGRFLVDMVTGTLTVVLLWYISGYLLFGNVTDYASGGLGYFSMNLNALFNSFSTSQIVPTLSTATDGQYEGYNYLGLGMILLLMLSATIFLAHPSVGKYRAHVYPLCLVSLIFTALALSYKVTWFQTTIIQYPIGATGHELLDPFRSSGRFFWPVYYLLFLFALAVAATRLPIRIRSLVIATFLIIQIADLWPQIQSPRIAQLNKVEFVSRVQSSVWADLMQGVTKIVTLPPFSNSVQHHNDYKDLALLALKHGAQLTSGHTSRLSAKHKDATFKSIKAIISSGHPSEDEIYIIRPKYLERYSQNLMGRFACIEIDTFTVCTTPSRIDQGVNGVL